MKINEIVINHSATIQMRQFEPYQISVTMKAQIDEGDDPRRVVAKVRDMVKKEIDEQANKKKIERRESYLEEQGVEKTT